MTLDYRRCRFLLGASRFERLPADTGTEVAFAGRSNAGKSSVLNVVTGQKKLARTSKTPGRTREINLFQVTDQARIADLPGYGFAKVDRATRQSLSILLNHYLVERQSLSGLVLIMDSRHPIKEMDEVLISWCRDQHLPLHCLLTKADKLSRGRGREQLRTTQAILRHQYPDATIQLFSAITRLGLDELQQVLDYWFNPPSDPGLSANPPLPDLPL